MTRAEDASNKKQGKKHTHTPKKYRRQKKIEKLITILLLSNLDRLTARAEQGVSFGIIDDVRGNRDALNEYDTSVFILTGLNYKLILKNVTSGCLL